MTCCFGGNSRGGWGAGDMVAPVSFSGMEYASFEDTYIWFFENVKLVKGLQAEITEVVGEEEGKETLKWLLLVSENLPRGKPGVLSHPNIKLEPWFCLEWQTF